MAVAATEIAATMLTNVLTVNVASRSEDAVVATRSAVTEIVTTEAAGRQELT